MAATIYVWDGNDDQRMLRVDIKFMNEENNISTSLYLQHQKTLVGCTISIRIIEAASVFG
jgi:hypothetical protein